MVWATRSEPSGVLMRAQFTSNKLEGDAPSSSTAAVRNQCSASVKGSVSARARTETSRAQPATFRRLLLPAPRGKEYWNFSWGFSFASLTAPARRLRSTFLMAASREASSASSVSL